MEIKRIIENPEQIDILKWLKVVDVEKQSDRALVIVSASVLDVQLEKLLKTFLINDSNIDERLFKNNSALATFSSKINMCYYLGIISEHECRTINLVRRIRNVFAHEIDVVKLEDSDKLVGLCSNLNIPKGMYVPEIINISKDEMIPFDTDPFVNVTPKERFVKTFQYLTQYLDTRYLDVVKRRCEPYIAKTQTQILVESYETMCKINQEYVMRLEKERDLLVELKTQKETYNNLLEEKKKLLESSNEYIPTANEKPFVFSEKDELQLKEIEAEIEARKSNPLNDSELTLNVTEKEYEKYIRMIAAGIEKSYDQ